MTSCERKAPDFKTLRHQAEQILRMQDKTRTIDADEPDILRLLHELEVYQVELELQNEELQHAFKDLEAARDEYFALYDTAPVGFVTINRKGMIEQCNRAATEMLSTEKSALTGRFISSRISREDQRAYYAYLKAIAQKKRAAPCELRLESNGAPARHVLCEAVAHHDPFGFHQWRLALIDITHRKKAERELERRADQLARLSNELTLAEQRERRRLAELLHDNLQQLLAGARLHLEMLADENGLKDKAPYRSAYELIIESIKTARSLSSEISPPVLFQKGLGDALEWLARWMGKTHRLDVELEVDRDAPPVREELRLLLFQAVRELLFNIVKHAKTETARVEMAHQDERLKIVISDPGKGFDSGELLNPDNGGFGLFTIRERLQLLGGDFHIASTPGAGTTVVLTAPLQTADYGEAEPAAPYRQAGDACPWESETSEPVIRVLLVDDHSVMRDGLSTLLSRHADIEIAGEAADGEEAVDLARQLRPDVILMDINMPKMNGLEATRRIHPEMPHTRIIGLSLHEADDQAAAMKAAGACAYLNKSGNTEALLAAIREK